MRKLAGWLVCAAVLCGSTTLCAAEPVAAVDPQLQTLRKELSELQKQRDGLRRSIEQSDALAGLRKTRDESAKEFAELEKTDVALANARKAQKEAMAEYDRVLMAKSQAGGAALLKQKESIEAQRHDLLLQQAIVDVKLQNPNSPVQRALAKNQELAALQKAYRAIDLKDKAAHDAARQKYDEARKAALAALPEAKPLEEERARIKEKLADLDKQERELDAKLRDARNEVRKSDDAELKAAAAKVTAAQKQMEEARDSGKLKETREAARSIDKAMQEKVRELIAADPKGKELSSAIDAKNAQIMELQKKARAK